MGRVNKLKRVSHNQHKPLLKRLLAIKPLPSRKDIDRAKLMIDRLARDYATKNATYWYKKRFFIAHERLNILKRSFPLSEDFLRNRLSGLKHNYTP